MAIQTPLSQTKQIEEESTEEVSPQEPHQEEGNKGVEEEGTHTQTEKEE